MIKLENKQILIDGEPKLILCGEIHYFRLPKKEWQDRITKLKDAGFNAVATYIPWICHEETEGEFDLDGHLRDEHDLEGFIKLCEVNDLYFIARPGPFIMAEMKNEGIPHWVAEKYPALKPTTWDGKKAPNPTLDYLAPNFLSCVKKWYEKVMSLISNHLYQNGGNIIGVQLDNEIGMLSWCGNSPDLTEVVKKDFLEWIHHRYDKEVLKSRYPFDMTDETIVRKKLESPEEAYSLAYHQDLGYYMRNRTLRYVRILKEYANEYGVKDIPFLINIHGTSGGRGLTYPIGISQLYEAYTDSDEYLSGSDIYMGSLTMDNFADLYMINTYMEAVNRDNHPLTSLEFECGDCNYGETFGSRTDLSASDFKARMCIAQGNRLLNYYLFCGGYNYAFNKDYKDGNNRIAITGERHGFAAPVSPEGHLNYMYPRMARTIKTMSTMGDKINSMKEERDAFAFAFIPDYYMTEYYYPGSELAKRQNQDLTRFRAGDAFDRLIRAILLSNYRFTSVNVQDKEIPEDLKTLVLLSSCYMDRKIQQKLVQFIEDGGNLFLQGRIPTMDMEGESCTILKDKIGIRNMELLNQTPGFYLSVTPVSYLSDFAEVRCGYAECYEVEECIPLMTVTTTDKTCAFEKKIGNGKVIVFGTEYICNLEAARRLLNKLEVKAELSHNCQYHGMFMTMMANDQGERLLHVLNLDDFDKKAVIRYQGRELFDGKEILIQSKEGFMLPMSMDLKECIILYSTAEIYHRDQNYIIVRLTQEEDVIVLKGTGIVQPSKNYRIEEKEDKTYIISNKNGKVDTFLQIDYQ